MLRGAIGTLNELTVITDGGTRVDELMDKVIYKKKRFTPKKSGIHPCLIFGRLKLIPDFCKVRTVFFLEVVVNIFRFTVLVR